MAAEERAEAASGQVYVSNGGAQVTLVLEGTRQMLVWICSGLLACHTRGAWFAEHFLLEEGLVEGAKQE